MNKMSVEKLNNQIAGHNNLCNRMMETIDIITPFQDKFLTENNISIESFLEMTVEEKQIVTSQWKNSIYFKQCQIALNNRI
jgi:predicted sulfurtransferase